MTEIICWALGLFPFAVGIPVALLTPVPPDYLPVTSKPSPDETTAYLLQELWGGGLA